MKRVLGFFWLILSFPACNKNIDSAANKAYVAVTNLARGSEPLKITFGGQLIGPAGGVPFDSSTGVNLNRYDTAVAGIHDLTLTNVAGDKTFNSGNFSFLLNSYYFIYVYDTLTNGQYKLITVQDPHTVPASDTLSYYRFMNFCPDTAVTFFFLQHTYHDRRDSVYTSQFYPYVGIYANPNRYALMTGHYGKYEGYIYIDTVQAHRIPVGTVILPAGGVVSFLLTGHIGGTGADSLQLKTVYLYGRH